MFRIIYRLIPHFLKLKFNWMAMEQLQKEEKEYQSQLPYFPLTETHLNNLKIVPDRDTLLKLMPKNAIVAEVGVDEGEFSKRIVRDCKPAELHLIDAWDSRQYTIEKMETTKANLKKELSENKISFHRGYSFTELEKFSDHYFDWVYIDTDHTYETTRKELNICLKKVKNSGLIAGHDYVGRCANNFTRYGVVEAVNEFCIKNNWEFIYLTHEPNRHLSYVLRKIK
jgi:hypothetical protein